MLRSSSPRKRWVCSHRQTACQVAGQPGSQAGQAGSGTLPWRATRALCTAGALGGAGHGLTATPEMAFTTVLLPCATWPIVPMLMVAWRLITCVHGGAPAHQLARPRGSKERPRDRTLPTTRCRGWP